MTRHPLSRVTISNQPDQPPRRLSPNAIPSGSTLGMIFEQLRAEFVQNWRVPEFLVGIVAFPVMLYLMFGLPNAGQTLPEGTSVGAFMLASFAAYGCLGIALFNFGVDIAVERGRGWLKLMSATPMPAWLYFLGKLLMSMLFATLTLAVLFSVAYLFAGVRMPATQWGTLFATLLLGGLSFSTLGFTLGYWASPRGASPIANLIYLPLSFVSGLFFPLSDLPEVIQQIAPYLPTFHYGQLVWNAAGHPDDVALLTGAASINTLHHTLWLLGCFVLFGLTALWGYWRDRSREKR